jgi:hypothetical protein
MKRDTQINVRLPREIVDKLRERAEEESRTLTSLIEYLIRKALK